VQRLQDMVSRPRDGVDVGAVLPLSQLLLNSHSPVVLAALLDSAGHPVDESGAILFADTSSVTDPVHGQTRRRTRLRPIRQQDGLFSSDAMERGAVVSDLEVRQVLDAVRAEG
jgi:hypothetical protein